MSCSCRAGLGVLVAVALLEPEALPVAEIAARNAAAVVMLRVKLPEEPLAKQGTGFLVDPSGTIVTALHVVDRAERVLVRTADGRPFRQVRVRAYDAISDLAVLQIDGEDLATVNVGDTSGLEAGEPIVVISNPLGLSRTISEGVLGAWREPMPEPEQLLAEELEEDREFGARRRVRALPNIRVLQIGVPIAQGSSGAPVFDRSGAVIGVAVATAGYGTLDLNFAVPAERIMPLLEIDEGLTLPSLQSRADRDRADLAEPHIQAARLDLELGRDDEAAREIDAALQLFPGSTEAKLLESELLRRHGALQPAEQILLEVTLKEPESAVAWQRLGELYIQMDRGTGLFLEPAKEALNTAIALDDGVAAVAHGLGIIAVREGRYRSATTFLENARTLDPERAETGLWLGEVHMRMQRSGAAREAFGAACELRPADPLCHHGLARAYSAAGQEGQARDHYRSFLELTEGVPEHEALRERTILFLRRYPHLAPID